MTSSPSFVRAPEGNGYCEWFIRILKENLLWVRSFATVEELRWALLEFKNLYNHHWILEGYGYRRRPRQGRKNSLKLRRPHEVEYPHPVSITQGRSISSFSFLIRPDDFGLIGGHHNYLEQARACSGKAGKTRSSCRGRMRSITLPRVSNKPGAVHPLGNPGCYERESHGLF